MSEFFDPEAISAAFVQPNNDGSFQPEFEAYLQDLSIRPSVVLAFAPKAAGTYLRTAAIAAIEGKLVRTTYAQGGRDASFYLPVFLMYHAGHTPRETMVTHVHMQAFAANRYFMEALNLKPVIMIRSIPDMLASYADMLAPNPLSHVYWNNICVPADYASLSEDAKSDFLIDLMAPWYVSYFATWRDYAACAPGRVLVLDYDEFRADPVPALVAVLEHSGLAQSADHCRAAPEAVWNVRGDYRFNKGVSGRGRARFTPDQLARLARQVDYYPKLAAIRDRLIPPP